LLLKHCYNNCLRLIENVKGSNFSYNYSHSLNMQECKLLNFVSKLKKNQIRQKAAVIFLNVPGFVILLLCCKCVFQLSAVSLNILIQNLYTYLCQCVWYLCSFLLYLLTRLNYILLHVLTILRQWILHAYIQCMRNCQI